MAGGNSSPYDAAINAAAAQNNLNPDQLRGLIDTESSFNPNATNSTSGAMGLGQILPSTAANPGYGIAPLTDAYDPVANINFTAAYVAARGGFTQSGLAGYSGGGYSSVPSLGPSSSPVSSTGFDSSGMNADGTPTIPGAQNINSLTDFLRGMTQTVPGGSATTPGATPQAQMGPGAAPGAQATINGAAAAAGAVGGALTGFASFLPRIGVGLLALIMLAVALVAITRAQGASL